MMLELLTVSLVVGGLAGWLASRKARSERRLALRPVPVTVRRQRRQ
jgi:hypothetical protein